jgi:autotransporter-associated beta strand protein
VVHTAQAADGHSQLFLRGAISGSNGLTKSGSGELFLESTASTFGGPTTINAGMVIFAGSIAANAPSALGSSSADVVINAGVTDGQYVGLSSVAAGATFERNIVVQRNANSLAYIGAYGGLAATFTGQVSIGSGYLNLFGNIEPEMLTLSGAISGAGGLQEPGTQFPSLQHLRITAANTYSGGTVIRAGQWEVGSDSALGTGTVFFVGNNVDGSVQTGALQATNGPRTLANRLVLRATPVFSGNDALTFTGPVDLGSIPREVNVSSAADVTLAGAVGRGGLTKTGSGRLILSGPNTFNGQAVVAEGTLQAAHGSALGAATGPTMPGQATFITGSGTLELAGNISSAEAIYLGSDGAPITGSSPTGNLRSISGNNTLTGQLALDNLATVGVDAGSTLTLTATSVDNTTSANAALRKVGGGTLAVRNVRVPTLAISEGTVRVTSAGAPVGTSRISSLTVNAGAVLDLTNNALVYDYAATSPLTSVRSLLAAGQIVTTAAQAGARVGYAEASSVFTGTFPQSFAGQAVDNTTVLLLQTLAGDANLDRLVNFADLVSLAQNYNQGPNLVWRSGDFNYDGTVNFPDLVLLAQNYNRTASASLTAAAVTAQFGTELGADWAMAQSLVPEPTALGLLALALPLARRRR